MEIEFLDNRDVDGYRIYTKTVSAIFIMACKELYPDANASIEHFLGPGLYVKLDKSHAIRYTELKEIEKKMWEIIRNDYPIERKSYTKEEAIRIFEEHGYFDKIRLFNSIDKKVFFTKIPKVLNQFKRSNFGDFDGIHAHTLISDGIPSWILSKRLNKPLIISVRNKFLNPQKRFFLFPQYFVQKLRRSILIWINQSIIYFLMDLITSGLIMV